MSRMNAGLILAGQQPDFVNTLARSTQAAALANQNDRQRQMNALYQQHGQGILAGEQGSLNALAQMDPQQALKVQSVHDQRAMQQRQMDMDDRAFELKLSQFAAQASEAEKAKVAENLSNIMIGAIPFYQSGDLEGLNRHLETHDEEPLNSIEEFPAYTARNERALKTLKEVKALDKPADEYERYARDERAAGREPLSRIEYKKAGQKNMRVTSDGQGGFTVEETFGGQGGGKTPSERQSTLRLFGGLMNETMPAINAMEDDSNFNPVSPRSAAAGGGVVGNMITSPQARKYEALKRQWAEGVLRIQTGAAATEPEIIRVVETYFPRFGDDPSTIEQKRQQRDAFARSLVEASGHTMPAPGGADTRGGIGGASVTPPGEATFDFQNDEQRQIFEKYQ